MATIGYITLGGLDEKKKSFFVKPKSAETLQRERMALATDRKSNRCAKCFIAMPLSGKCDTCE